MEHVVTGWHFVGDTLRDGRPVPPDGEWLIHDGPVAPCESGLHMSEHPFDALRYAPGSTLCLVELAGDITPHGDPIDKWAGRRRRIICRKDVTALLRRFAADEALLVSHLWNMPDIVRQYLETLDESLRAAARAAAWSASDATRAATWADAARAAAEDATRAASWSAAWAASDVRRTAMYRARQRADFERRVHALFFGS